MKRLRERFGFTKTEAEVAVRLVEGFSYADIAEELGVSYHTIHTHIKAIHTKAEVATTGQLIALVRGALDVQR
jgi:DNA-binding CsgD family transcriptional regulator